MTDDTRRLNEGRFTETAARYAASRAASYLTQNEALLRLAAPRRRDRALDVACGPGALLATLAPRVRLAVGLDLTTAMLHQARGRFPSGSARLIRGAAERLPFADHSFSLVTCTSAVHHFGEATRVVEEMVRVCASGGRLVIADLVGADDDAVRARQNAIERLRDPAHVELRSPNGLRALLLAAGTVPAGMAEGREARQLGEWCHIANTPPATVQRVRELLLATQPGDLAGMSPAVVGDEVHFSHRWAIVLAERH